MRWERILPETAVAGVPVDASPLRTVAHCPVTRGEDALLHEQIPILEPGVPQSPVASSVLNTGTEDYTAAARKHGAKDCRWARHDASMEGCGGSSSRPPRVQLEEAEGPGLGIPVVGVDGERPDFHLRICDGKYVGSIYCIPPIRELPGIGRSRRNAICLLADDQVSRFQAHLAATPDGHVRLCDGSAETGARSSNGTFLNSNCHRIDPMGHRLFYGDVIFVGATEMVVEPCAAAENLCTAPPLQASAQDHSRMQIRLQRNYIRLPTCPCLHRLSPFYTFAWRTQIHTVHENPRTLTKCHRHCGCVQCVQL